MDTKDIQRRIDAIARGMTAKAVPQAGADFYIHSHREPTVCLSWTGKPGGSYALSGKLVSAVPEPATYGMLGIGLGMVGLMARRQRRRGPAA